MIGWSKGEQIVRQVLTVMVVLATVLVGGSIGTSSASASAMPTRDSAERDFLALLNQERTNRGMAALQHDPALVPIAREWSAHMAATGVLAHRPDHREQVEARVTREWRRIGENVGRGGSVSGLHKAFMDSPAHQANVLGDYNRLGVGVVVSGSTIWVTFNFLNGPALADATHASAPSGDFWLTTSAGEVHSFGSAPFYGSLGGQRLNKPIVGIAATPSRQGYWLVASDGGVFSYGDARFFGSTGAMRLNQPIVGIAPTPTGKGYWLVASDGGVFSFGDARFMGSTGAIRLNQPILSMAATPTGKGYWMTASDGGIFAFGDARFLGSTGGRRLAAPIVGMASTPTGKGYWLVGRDGAVFTFGDAPFHGSAAGKGMGPVAGIAITGSGSGYRLIGDNGQVASFGDAGSGTSGPLGLARPVVSLALA